MQGLTSSEVDAINAEASVLMKQGIRLLDTGERDGAAEALVFFDRALALRRGLPIDDVPALGYLLAACWLNRADALTRLGTATQLTEALGSYDEGIRLLSDLPLGEDARFPRRLAIAHQNRGLALLAQGGAAAAEARAAYSAALAILEHEQAVAIPDRQHLVAAVWMNLANAHALESTPESWALATTAAWRAIDLVGDSETHEADAAEVGLKSRYVLCQALAEHLSQASTAGHATHEDVHKTTDLVDDALGLVRAWEKRGSVRFRQLACDLFRFGARVYAKYQPQFLNEFVLENMDPERSSADYVNSAEMRAAATEALGLASRP